MFTCFLCPEIEDSDSQLMAVHHQKVAGIQGIAAYGFIRKWGTPIEWQFGRSSRGTH